MKLKMIGCQQKQSRLSIREKLAFSPIQAREALSLWREEHPTTEAVLLSTCNRVELYAAVDGDLAHPCSKALTRHLAQFHNLPVESLREELVSLDNEEAAKHLFRVAAGLDSMVVGESQILAQVKKAYEMAQGIGCAGPITHQFFQAAVKTARRVSNETSLHQHRVSIPSVAVSDFAGRIFERFDDKRILVIGAGEMAEETLRYLVSAGARHIAVANRNFVRAEMVAENWSGRPVAWDSLYSEIARADLVISATGSEQQIVTLNGFQENVVPVRHQKPLFILDLAVPRDFQPDIGKQLNTFLYSIDDLAATCKENLLTRQGALPKAEHIVEQETHAFLTSLRHRRSGPVIAELRRGFDEVGQQELTRLFRKLPELGTSEKLEIERFADRLVGKLLHPPLESLRDESKNGSPNQLLEALRRLFQLND